MWVRSRFEVSLPCAALAAPRAAVQKELRSRLGRYSELLDGVPLDVRKVRILDGGSAQVRHDSGELFAEVACEVRVFAPRVGDEVRARVRSVRATHAVAHVEGAFNAVVAPLDARAPPLRPGADVTLLVTDVELRARPPHLRATVARLHDDEGRPDRDDSSRDVTLEGAEPPTRAPTSPVRAPPRRRSSATSDSDDSEEGGAADVRDLQADIIKKIMRARQST